MVKSTYIWQPSTKFFIFQEATPLHIIPLLHPIVPKLSTDFQDHYEHSKVPGNIKRNKLSRDGNNEIFKVRKILQKLKTMF